MLGKRKAEHKVDLNADDHTYVNIEVANPVTSTTSVDATYSQSRTVPILDCPCDHHVSVIRATIPALSIPLFEFKDNFYYVRIRVGADNYDALLSYDNRRQPDPGRGIFCVADFLRILNVAISSSFQQAKLAHPGIAATASPFFSFDAASQLLGFTAQDQEFFYNSDSVAFAVNFNLFALFPNFFWTTDTAVPVPTDPFDTASFYYMNTSGYCGPAAAATRYFSPNNVNLTGLTLTQDFPTVPSWNQVVGIVLTSSLSVKSELLPSSVTSQSASSSANSLRILVDFVPDFTSQRSAGYVYQYSPQVLRLLDCIGGTPLTYLELTANWRDASGNLHKITLLPGMNMSVKLQFTKRGADV